MYPYCYFNGKIIKSDKPLLKLNDIAILRGYAAFDFMRIYDKKLFHFEDHMKRFRNTAKLMGLKLSFSDKQIKDVLESLINKNKNKDYQVRFVLTGGETKNGLQPSTPVFYILFEKRSDLPKPLYKNGAKLITHEYCRTLSEAKNSNYLQAVLLQGKRIKEKSVEILYVCEGKVLEASTSNIFIVKNSKLFTPKENILKGITRKVVMEIAKKLKLELEEKEITIEELLKADEVFLSATNKKVLPIVQIDSHKIGNAKVGEVTKKLLEEYDTLIQ